MQRKCKDTTKQLDERLDYAAKLKRMNSKLEKNCKDLKNAKEVVTISDCSECEMNSKKIKESERRFDDLSKTLQNQIKTYEQNRITLQTQKNFYKMKYDDKCKTKRETMKLLKDMLKDRDSKIVDLEAKVIELKGQVYTFPSNFSFEHESNPLQVKTEIKIENNF